MINALLFLFLFCALLISAMLFVSTQLRINFRKKAFFAVFIVCVFIFLLGYMLEITSSTTEGAFYCSIVFYIGGSFAAPFFLLFVADYCEINIKKPYIAVIMALSAAMPILAATSSHHNLFFKDYFFSDSFAIRHLQIVPGPLFYAGHIFSYLCVLAGGIMLTRYSLTSNIRLKRQALLIFAGALLPVVSNIIFLLSFQKYSINFTPIAMALVMALFYKELMHNHISNLVPEADKHVLSVMRDAFLILDAEQRLLKANPAFYSLFPETGESSEGQAAEHIAGWPKELHDLSLVEKSKVDPRFCLERNGEILYFSASVSKIATVGDLVTGWTVLLRDTSDTVKLVQKLESIAYKDSLTGIFNRGHFMQMAEIEFARAQRTGSDFSIIILDIDFFKNINDTYGHKAGDCVLKGVVKCVQSVLRPYNILARYGGEEFIILADMNGTHSAKLAERVKKAISDSEFDCGNTLIKCNASFGVASRCDSSQSVESIINKADIALYMAKNNGRNRVVLYDENGLLPEIIRSSKSHFENFMLYYQPIFSSKSGKLTGAEALLRLRSHEGEILLPHSLLPVLEKLGLMRRMEVWILETACAQCKKWTSFFESDFYVHVNLSRELLNSGKLYETVMSALKGNSLSPQNLVLSLRVFNSAGENGSRALQMLRSENVRIAADSFGKGHTPLVEFKHLDVDEIRIDKSFVSNIDTDSHSLNLLDGIVHMLESVDRKVSVVGVETDSQKRCLTEIGVDLLQGYLLGRPTDARSFEKKYLAPSAARQ